MWDFLNSLQDGTVLNGLFDQVGLTGGVLIVLGVGILIFLIVAIVAERKTRILFPDRKRRGNSADDGFLNFDDDEDEDEPSK